MKRAQIQLGETIFTVIILILLFVFGLVFYSGSRERGTDRQETLLQDLDAIAISKYVGALSELQCSSLQVRRANCLNMLKLDGFVRFRQERPDLFTPYYFTQLGNAMVRVDELYPSTQSWVLYNNTLGETPRRVSSSLIPVSIHNPVLDRHSFAILTLEQYYR